MEKAMPARKARARAGEGLNWGMSREGVDELERKCKVFVLDDVCEEPQRIMLHTRACAKCGAGRGDYRLGATTLGPGGREAVHRMRKCSEYNRDSTVGLFALILQWPETLASSLGLTFSLDRHLHKDVTLHLGNMTFGKLCLARAIACGTSLNVIHVTKKTRNNSHSHFSV